MGCHDKELSVLFTDDRRMAQLNVQYRGKEGPTNVLSFPMSDGDAPGDRTPDIETALLGDVVISVDTAQAEAKASGESFEQTVDRLLIHGILHLLGYDHVDSDEQAALMEREEERLFAFVEGGKEIWHA